MAFPAKTDYFGLATSLSSSLSLKNSSLNDSTNVVEAQDEKGDVVAEEVLDPVASPSVTYEVKDDVDLDDITLGAVHTIGTGASARAFAIESVSFNTAPATVPELTVSGQEVESGATTANSTTIELPSVTLKKWHDAQIIGSAFELSGTGCYLQGCNYTVRGDISKATVNGKCVAHDIQNGRIECQATIAKTGTTAPTVTPATGWIVTSPLTIDEPDENYPTYTVTFTKYLTSEHPAPSNT